MRERGGGEHTEGGQTGGEVVRLTGNRTLRGETRREAPDEQRDALEHFHSARKLFGESPSEVGEDSVSATSNEGDVVKFPTAYAHMKREVDEGRDMLEGVLDYDAAVQDVLSKAELDKATDSDTSQLRPNLRVVKEDKDDVPHEEK